MGDLALPIENGAYGVEAGSILAQLGLAEIANYLEDDWGDNSLTSRSSTEDGVFAHPDANEAGDMLIGRYRPDWNTVEGSPSASSEELNFSGSNSVADALLVSSNFTVGSFSFNFRQTNAGDPLRVWIFSSSFNGYTRGGSGGIARPVDSYFVATEQSALSKDDSGSKTNLVTGTSISDTNNHSESVTRNSYGDFEFFVDSTSQGTATDTTFTESLFVGVSSRSNVTMDNLVIQ